ncbi:unnamed protein product [Pleuronectes platessa]|uniref:Uncharacterized protein n=1 Tax=Pleuronectes platessa TaxID=8262 RepID=A0A9N7UFY0_PLEPL|nr:unnamed protein product [Pleuronectes platessa]
MAPDGQGSALFGRSPAVAVSPSHPPIILNGVPPRLKVAGEHASSGGHRVSFPPHSGSKGLLDEFTRAGKIDEELGFRSDSNPSSLSEWMDAVLPLVIRRQAAYCAVQSRALPLSLNVLFSHASNSRRPSQGSRR